MSRNNKGFSIDEMARMFMEKVEIGRKYSDTPDCQDTQFDVFEEEVDELVEAYGIWSDHAWSRPVDDIGGDVDEIVREDVAEELADVMVTVVILAEMMEIDIIEAYRMKMMYNMKKGSTKEPSGKVSDDYVGEKPDFKEVVGEW